MIQVTKLNKTYDRARLGDHRVLKDVSFQLPDTGFVCILGPSGCGKTSLLNAIGGLDRFDSGTLSTGDTTVKSYGTKAYEAQRNRNFGYIFQNYYLLEKHTVAYNVALGLHSLELSQREKMKRVRMALEAVDMGRYIRRRVGELSGGQQQRIAIARALVRRPRVIFADEPTGNLDEDNTRNICTLLRQASRESLVIMVTHEERIANFFADRIIRLDQGVVSDDRESWDRQSLAGDSDREIYTGDYVDTKLTGDRVSLRLLRTEDAPPVELTVIASGDRILIRLEDGRTATLTEAGEPPRILEGTRPVMTLETVDSTAGEGFPLFKEPPAPQCQAGKGVTFSMMAGEALRLMKGKGIRQVGMRIFLILLSVLTLLTVADYITLSKVDPQDFITADSHILTVKIKNGSTEVPSGSPDGFYTWTDYYADQYVQYISKAPTDFDFLPLVSEPPRFTVSLFYQMDHAQQSLPVCSLVDIKRVSASQLLCGRMPETSEEVVIDRILLDAMLENEGIVQNSIQDYTTFLGEQLIYDNRGLNPTIVGISNSGERAMYLTPAALYTLGESGHPVITVSELRDRYPGKYDVLNMRPDGVQTLVFNLDDLQENECILNTAKAGAIWQHRIGQLYGFDPNRKTMRGYILNENISASMIVRDDALVGMVMRNYGDTVDLWCADKDAMKAYLAQPTQMEQDGNIIIEVRDPYEEKFAEYKAAASLRADARTIVTATVLVLCMVMLYLLCRTKVNERLGLIAVYRLLGIPGRKLTGIFLLEGLIVSAGTVLPAAALMWVYLAVAAKVPELGAAVELPLGAAALSAAGIIAYYLLVSVLPLWRLLRLPPAQLAAKYDM